MTATIKGLIFDLDDTLYDCTGQLTQPARHRASQHLSATSPNLSPHEADHQQAILAQTLGSAGAIRALGQKYHIPSNIIEEALDIYNTPKVEAITPFSDTHATLHTLSNRGYQITLVTSGHPDRQRTKIQLLDLNTYFNEAQNTLFLHDDRKSSDKAPYLKQAMQALNLAPEQILAVGDKLTAEISAANTLGMTTVHMRHGRQKDRAPQTPQEQPDHQIDQISDLLSILSIA